MFRAGVIGVMSTLILASCSSGPASPSPSRGMPSTTPLSSAASTPNPTHGPTFPAEPDLLFSLSSTCPIPPPQVRPEVTITGTGKVILRGPGATRQWSVRQLSAAGLERIRQDVLEAPLLGVSGNYPLELRPNVGIDVGNVGLCDAYTLVLGSGADGTVVTSTPWQGDEYESNYAVPSPERKELDRLAHWVIDIGNWLEPDGWADAAWSPYLADSYLLRTVAYVEFPAPDGTPSSVGVAWPFAGPIEAFGDPVGETGRCGYLNQSQALETVALLRGLGIDARLDAPTDLIDLTTDAGWLRAVLWPRTPDAIPNCADEAPAPH